MCYTDFPYSLLVLSASSKPTATHSAYKVQFKSVSYHIWLVICGKRYIVSMAKIAAFHCWCIPATKCLVLMRITHILTSVHLHILSYLWKQCTSSRLNCCTCTCAHNKWHLFLILKYLSALSPLPRSVRFHFYCWRLNVKNILLYTCASMWDFCLFSL